MGPLGSRSLWGNVCQARARRATFVLRILSLAPSLSSPRESPKWTTLDRKPSLQSTLHKPKYENSTTQNVTPTTSNHHRCHKLGAPGTHYPPNAHRHQARPGAPVWSMGTVPVRSRLEPDGQDFGTSAAQGRTYRPERAGCARPCPNPTPPPHIEAGSFPAFCWFGFICWGECTGFNGGEGGLVGESGMPVSPHTTAVCCPHTLYEMKWDMRCHRAQGL